MRIFLTFCLLFIGQLFYSQSLEQEMLDLVNEIRQDRGLNPVQLNTLLNQAAFNHSQDMATNNYFSHEGLNGSSFSERIVSAGYSGSPRSENIAAGNATVQATFNQWVNSSGHLNNILNRSVNEMGIGRAYNSNSRYGYYWTQVFGIGDTTLSNEEYSEEAVFTIYPNPTKDKFKVQLKNHTSLEVNIRLVSMTGKIVYHKNKNFVEDTLTVDISNLTAGVYFLYIENFKEAYKVVKL